MNIFGILDNTNLEDLYRIIFGYKCGVLLNFERMFNNLFKIYKRNKFSDLILVNNEHVFTKNFKSDPLPEDVMYA